MEPFSLKPFLAPSTLVCVSVVGTSGELLYVNEALQSRLREEVAGKKCWSLLKDDKIPCQHCPLERGIKPGQVVSTEAKSLLGERIFQIQHFGVVYQGKEAVLEVFQDITHQKRVDEFNRELSKVVEQTADAVMITDTLGRIEYANPSFEAMTGYGCEEVLGKSPRILKSGLHHEGFYEKLWKTVLSGEPYRAIITNRKKNGDLYYAAKVISPLMDEEGRVTRLVSTDRDITEQKQMGDELAKIRIEDEKLKLIRTISTTYAHHIFNAITPVRGFAELMTKKSELTDRQRYWMNAILENVAQVVDLVNKLEKVNAADRVNFGGIEILDIESSPPKIKQPSDLL